METVKQIAVIGAGASGFFGAIMAARKNPLSKVVIYEKSQKVLSKVRISGGGRCNVTHNCFDASALVEYYPRGKKELLGPFHRFSPEHTVAWFRECGVALKTEEDGRIFPVSNDSATIVNCLLAQAETAGVQVITETKVKKIQPLSSGKIRLFLEGSEEVIADAVLIASGGYPVLASFNWLAELGHSIVPPVPSLFTFNMPGNKITALMGLSVSNAMIRITGTKFSQQGPLLITHWGMSGPAVLKLSSLGARKLSEMNYEFETEINWSAYLNVEQVKEQLNSFRKISPKKKVNQTPPGGIPKRLWEFLVNKAEITDNMLWADLPAKLLNQLSAIVHSDKYPVQGKTTFKEEFVTCGGVSLREVDFKTMQSKIIPNLYFAGEILDIDALTGGFNFQAAWTTGFIAGESMASN
ncbi:MAG TPA: NAD(P)/FAD-dependent oxidoreductase [Bacteroidia bacterium]|nr:NAD(P)/FAD-dependent oxidoreductase [Bacteroidia bacterium]